MGILNQGMLEANLVDETKPCQTSREGCPMEELRRLRLRLIGLFYLGAIVLTGFAYHFQSIFALWFLVPWLLFVNLLGWVLKRKVSGRQPASD